MSNYGGIDLDGIREWAQEVVAEERAAVLDLLKRENPEADWMLRRSVSIGDDPAIGDHDLTMPTAGGVNRVCIEPRPPDRDGFTCGGDSADCPIRG